MSIALIEADWPAPEGIVAVCTTRAGGVSEGVYTSLNLGDHVGDHASHVAENRRRLREYCDWPDEPIWLRQVHGHQVVSTADPDVADEPPEADAIVSADGLDVIAILTADCLPIVMCSDATSELAAMHCGWRSLSGGIVNQTIETLNARPDELLAWLGPAISQRAFEVGDEVRDVFLAGVDDAASCFWQNDEGRWQADLYGLARLYLEAAGVERIFGGDWCTHSDSERFFSYRRDGQTGRLATSIYRRSSP